MLVDQTKIYIKEDWYIACRSSELAGNLIGKKMVDQKILLFRDKSGAPVAMADRCPHRGVSLSKGKLANGEVHCIYHGWSFSSDGTCTRIPATENVEVCAQVPKVPKYVCKESQGFIWVYSKSDVTPHNDPYQIPGLNEGSNGAYYVDRIAIQAHFHSAIENFVDVTHTRFLHEGLARVDNMKEITAKVTTGSNRILVEYLNEPQPEGLIFKIIAPKGSKFRHVDSVVAPGVVESRYEFGQKYFFQVNDIFTPVSENESYCYSVTIFNLPIPHVVFSFFARLFGNKLIRQDIEILKNQNENITNRDGEKFFSGPGDILTAKIYSLLSRKNLPNDEKKSNLLV